MANYTTNLNLEKPLQSEQYNVDVFNANADKIDQFAGQVPARALTADTLTVARKINGVSFKGDNDIITGLGLHDITVTYNQSNLAYKVIDDEVVVKRCLNNNTVGDNFDDDTKWEKVELGGGNGYEVGDVIWRLLPTEDGGKHLLDGTLISGSGSYSAFVDYITDLYTADPTAAYFTTEADWQTAVSTYGVCGKFVYDDVNNTVRLPKVTGIIEGTIDSTALGDLVGAGLPNLTGRIGPYCVRSGITFGKDGVFGNTNLDNLSRLNDTTNLADGSRFINFDASADNSIYGNSNTVQPQTIKGFMYIVIATSTKTDRQVDIDKIATDLNGKADVDLTNVNDTGYIKMAGAGMPSDTYETFTVGASGSEYIAPANGWVFAYATSTSATGNKLALTNADYGIGVTASITINNTKLNALMPVQKNANFGIYYTNVSDVNLKFYYAKGSESEAS